MNDSFGGGFSQAISDAKTESKAEGTLPVFIKMIHKQADDVVKLFGQEYKMITLVAIVRNIDHSSTKITYELEDKTGRIHAHLWIDEDLPRTTNIILNSYIRLVGGVRNQANVKSIMIYKIHPVSGINEVNTHYIEVVNARLQAEEFAGGKQNVEIMKTNNKMDVDSTSTGNEKPIEDQNDGMEGLSAKEKIVFKMIRGALADKGDEGFHRDVIVARFPHISKAEIDNMLIKMSTEGLIYTTVDNDHFQACF